VKLTIGILHYEAGWEILLRQIGVNWKAISTSDELNQETFSALIVNAEPTSLQEKYLEEYLVEGGAILALGSYVQHLVHSKLKRKYFSSLPPSLFGRFGQMTMMDIYSSGMLDVSSFNQTHQLPSIHKIGKGVLATIPFNVSDLVLDARSKRKNFYFNKERLPNEIVATVSKGNLRRFITEILQFLHHERGIPFIHKWYYPENRETIFTFRVDSDQGSPAEVNDLHSLCEKRSIKTMWFIDAKSHEQWLSRFKDFGSQDIGIHCYEHMTFSTEEKNLQNILKALSLLNAEELRPKGAAAPYGTWNASISSVFEQIGAGFSSEFSLDYDDLPFFPFVGGKLSPVLQIPIHPICVGSMRRTGYSEKEMKKYFLQLIDSKLLQREPLCLYHHPTHHHLNLFADVFDYIRSKKIDNYSYPEYASWWRKRDEIGWTHHFNQAKDELTAQCTDRGCGVYWRIVFPNGEESIVNSEGILPLQSLPRRHPPAKPIPPADIIRSRDYDFRHLILNVLDAWYKRTQ
jgi:hypothetical protein